MQEELEVEVPQTKVVEAATRVVLQVVQEATLVVVDFELVEES